MPMRTAKEALERVLIVDARELRRSAIARLFGPWAEEHGLDLVEATPEAALASIESGDPCALAVLSIGGDSIQQPSIQRQLRLMRVVANTLPIIVMSDLDEPAEVLGALAAGVDGFLPTVVPHDLAMQALAFILAGGSYFPPAAVRQLPQELSSGSDESGGDDNGGPSRPRNRPPLLPQTGGRESDDSETGCTSMTERQKEVLDHLRRGEPNKIIARKLGMTEATVKVHVRQILRKLGATNRTQAALSAGLVDSLEDGKYPAAESGL